MQIQDYDVTQAYVKTKKTKKVRHMKPTCSTEDGLPMLYIIWLNIKTFSYNKKKEEKKNKQKKQTMG